LDKSWIKYYTGLIWNLKVRSLTPAQRVLYDTFLRLSGIRRRWFLDPNVDESYLKDAANLDIRTVRPEYGFRRGSGIINFSQFMCSQEKRRVELG
jgi:hypothetical protein